MYAALAGSQVLDEVVMNVAAQCQMQILPPLAVMGTGRVDRVPSDCRKQSFEDFG